MAGDHASLKRGPVVITNLSTSSNLGHYLWNDISGIVNLRKAWAEANNCRTAVAFPRYLFIDLPRSPFSDETYSDFIRRYQFIPGFKKYAGVECWNISCKDIEFTRPLAMDGVPVSPMVLKSHVVARRMSRLASRARRRRLKDSETGQKRANSIRVMLNLRYHNKRGIGIHEPARRLMTFLVNRFPEARIALVLEHSSPPGVRHLLDDIETFEENMGGIGVALETASSLGPVKLISVLKSVDLVVCPVGSGMVLPTWLLGIPVIAHGDRSHMNQLRMWPHVAPYFPDLDRRIAGVWPRDQMTGAMYSDYTVDDNSFVRAARSLIKAGVLVGELVVKSSHSPRCNGFAWFKVLKCSPQVHWRPKAS